MLIIGIIVFYYGSDQDGIVSYVGFAATLSSLLLSVAALIYTFFQSTTSTNQTQKLSDASDRLIQTSDGLIKVMQEFKDTHEKSSTNQTQKLSDTSDRLIQTSDGLIDVMQEFKDTHNQLSDTVESMGVEVFEMRTEFSSFQTNMNLNSINGNSTLRSISEKDLEEMLSGGSVNGALAIAICLYQNKYPKEIELYELLESLSQLDSSWEISYNLGFIIAFNMTGIINIEETEGQVKFDMDDSKIILNAVNKFLIYATSDASEGSLGFLQGKIVSLRNYYDDKDIGLIDLVK